MWKQQTELRNTTAIILNVPTIMSCNNAKAQSQVTKETQGATIATTLIYMSLISSTTVTSANKTDASFVFWLIINYYLQQIKWLTDMNIRYKV